MLNDASYASMQEQINRINNTEEMIARGEKALKWIKGELAIAKNVFPEGHPKRQQKLAERMAMQRYLEDVLQMLYSKRNPF